MFFEGCTVFLEGLLYQSCYRSGVFLNAITRRLNTLSHYYRCQTLPFIPNWFLFGFPAVCVPIKKAATPEISCSFSKHTSSSHDPAPIISLPTQRGLNHNGFSSREEMAGSESSAPSFTEQPIFFRSVLLQTLSNSWLDCI